MIIVTRKVEITLENGKKIYPKVLWEPDWEEMEPYLLSVDGDLHLVFGYDDLDEVCDDLIVWHNVSDHAHIERINFTEMTVTVIAKPETALR